MTTARIIPDRENQYIPLLRSGYLLTAPNEVTIDTGEISVSQGSHTVDTEGDAGTDNLDTITGVPEGMLLLLRPASAARTVVLRHGVDNIKCPGGEDISLAEAADQVLLYSDGTYLIVIAASVLATGGGGLGAALASVATGKGAALVGVEDALGLFTATTVEAALAEIRTTLRLKTATNLTIATGAVTAVQSAHLLDTEAAAGSDDLDTITFPVRGLYVVGLVNAGHNVVIKHNTGNLLTPGGSDITLDLATDYAVIYYDGSKGVVVGLRLGGADVTTTRIAASAVTAAKAAVFVSAEQTATGAAQNVAHGLGATPSKVLIVPTLHPGTPDTGAFTLTEGAHDGTNVVVTMTINCKFKVLAWA